MGMQLCIGFNNCKFIITQTMKFGIAKLPKTFYKNTEKSLYAKKNNEKDLSSFQNRKVPVNTKFCYG